MIISKEKLCFKIVSFYTNLTIYLLLFILIYVVTGIKDLLSIST